MKVLYCKNCGDLYNLKASSNKTCNCGTTGGIEEDGAIQLHGDPFILELNEQRLGEAIVNQIQNGSKDPQKIILSLLPPNFNQ